MDNKIESLENLDTRSHIASIAIKLFAQHGFDGTSIRDIVEEAGVTKPVLYYYFKSKEELFITLITEAYDMFLSTLRKGVESDEPYPQKIKYVIHLYFEDCKKEEEEDLVRLIYMAMFGPRRSNPPEEFQQLEKEHFNLLYQLLAEGVDNGFIRKVPLEGAVWHFLGAVNIYLMGLLRHGPVPDHFEKNIYDFLFNGIGETNP